MSVAFGRVPARAGRNADMRSLISSTVLWVVGQIATMGVAARTHGVSIRTILFQYDALWYQRIATHGYVWGSGQSSDAQLYAFFPMFPALSALLANISPLTVRQAMLVVAWMGAMVAVLGYWAVVNELCGRSAAFFAVVMWTFVPRSFVMVIPYTESVLLACLTWGFYAVLKKRWRAAAVCGSLAALCRPTAVVFLGTLWCLWAISLLPGGRSRRLDQLKDSGEPEAWRAALPGTMVGGAWIAFITWRVGRIDAYFWIQQHFWLMRSVLPGRWFEWALNVPEVVFSSHGVLALLVGVVAVLLSFVVLLGARWVPWWMKLHSFVVIWISLGVGSHHESVGRFLLMAFPVWIPLAATCSRHRRRGAWLLLALFLAMPWVHAGTFMSEAAW